MDQTQLLHTIALPLIPEVGPQTAKQLISSFSDASAVFAASADELVAHGVRPPVAKQLLSSRDKALMRAEKEVAFVEHHNLMALRFDEDAYPDLLRNTPDAPLLLYGKGNMSTQGGHFLSVVGTRIPSDRGRQLCHDLIRDLADRVPNLTIVSGLAYGIDVTAHKAAIEFGLPTIAIPAHGLDRIYPAANRQVAVDALANGGILTEYMSGTEPERSNFLARNRIIAGMSEATIVVESKSRGGSLNTAHVALDYGRDVFAFPGRPADQLSEGCNMLIRKNVAGLITSADDLIEAMGWDTLAQPKQMSMESLFADLNPVEQQIMDVLRANEDGMHINMLVQATGLPYADISVTLFSLEIAGHVRALPGSCYRAAH